MRILVTGGSGTIALALHSHLKRQNHDVTLVSRNPAPLHKLGYDCISWTQLSTAYMLSSRFDAVFNMAGASMMKRWSEQQKSLILSSRLETITHLYMLVRALPRDRRPECIFNASSIAIYSNSDNEVDEYTAPSRDSSFFQARAWLAIERRIRQLRIPGVRTVIARMGVVLANDTAMRVMLNLSKLRLCATLGTGSQRVSWISQIDLLRAFSYLLETTGKAGIYNLVAPKHIDAETFTRNISNSAYKNLRLNIPARYLELLLGELAQNFLSSIPAKPRRLIEDEFEWRLPVHSQAVQYTLRQIRKSSSGSPRQSLWRSPADKWSI